MDKEENTNQTEQNVKQESQEQEYEKQEENEQINDQELYLPELENTKDEIYIADNESDSSYDSTEQNDDEEETLTRQVLQQLITHNKMKQKENKRKEKLFIPSIKNYLKLDFERKIKKVRENATLLKNFNRVCSY